MGKNKFSVRDEYRRLRRLNWPPVNALTAARVNMSFRAAEFCGLVRFDVEPDEGNTLNDLVGEGASNKLRNNFAKRINTEGVWGIVVHVKCDSCRGWREVDSVWGFIGNDFQDSFY